MSKNFNRLYLVTKWLDCLISDTPNVATMLHFDQSKWNINETCHRAVDVVGIATIEFTKHYTHPIYGEYDLKYYWTGKKLAQFRIRTKAGITLYASLKFDLAISRKTSI